MQSNMNAHRTCSPRALALVAIACLLLLGQLNNLRAQQSNEPPAQESDETVQLPPLPDFSWAGYHAGERALPDREPTVNIEDFGAKPDGETDCTQAMQDALAKVHADEGGVLRIPAGRWLLTGTLDIRKSNIVIKGDGADRTVLVCPKSLTDIHGASPGWSWGGGMIRVQPSGRSTRLGTVAGATERGATTLPIAFVEGAKRPEVGEWLQLLWFNDKGEDTLLDHLYGGVIARERMGAELQASNGARVRERVKVAAVSEDGITITQPLRLPCTPAWRVTVERAPFVSEVGVEGLTFEFPRTAYPGHLKEKGYNGISINGAVNSFVRDVRTVNADSGIFVNASKYVTVTDVEHRGRYMHHVLSTSWSQDCLFTRFRIDAPHRHGTTISWSAHGNVFSQGHAKDLAMDSHRAASFENLHTRITIEHGNRIQNVFRSGGSFPRGPHAARDNVYWNIEHVFPPSERPVRIGPVREWPLAVFAGWRGNRAIELAPARGLEQRVLWLNAAPPVADLHAAQLAARLKARDSADD